MVAAMIDREGYRPNVGIILCNAHNQVFWGKRVNQHAWQFPQGGINAGETPEQALVRELHEELGIETATSCLAPIAFASHGYETFHLLMPVFACRKWLGTPQSREGQALRWVMPMELSRYPMPPADVPLVGLLRDLL